MKSTKHIGIHATQASIAALDVVPRFGRSARFNGRTERFEAMYEAGKLVSERFTSEDLQTISSYIIDCGKAGSWILDWAAAGALFTDEISLKEKVLSLTECEAAAFEEWLDRNIKVTS